MRLNAIEKAGILVERRARFADLAVITTAGAMFLVILSLPLYPQLVQPDDYASLLVHSFRSAVQLRIALELIVAALSIRSRRSWFPVVSTAALALIVLEYCAWWFTNFTSAEVAARFWFFERLFLANGAGVWDVWVFALALMALIYRLRYLYFSTPTLR